MNRALADFRFAVRRFFNRPAESLLAFILLSFGIAANISTFAVIESLCWRPSSDTAGGLAQLQPSRPKSGRQSIFPDRRLGWSGEGTLQRVDEARTAPETVAAPTDREPISSTLLVSFGMASLLFLVASANAASLVVAHSRSRETELAVRRALRAGAARLLRRWAWEAFLVSGLAGFAGLIVAKRAVPLFGYWSPPGSDGSLPWDGSPAFFAVIATAIGAFLVLALPAARLARPALAAALGLAGGTADPDRPRLRKTAAVGAMMLSLLALAACGLLLDLDRSHGPTAAQNGFGADRLSGQEFSLAADGGSVPCEPVEAVADCDQRDQSGQKARREAGVPFKPADPSPANGPAMEPVL